MTIIDEQKQNNRYFIERHENLRKKIKGLVLPKGYKLFFNAGEYSSNYADGSYRLNAHFTIVSTNFFKGIVAVIYSKGTRIVVEVFNKKMYESMQSWFKEVEYRVMFAHYPAFVL